MKNTRLYGAWLTCSVSCRRTEDGWRTRGGAWPLLLGGTCPRRYETATTATARPRVFGCPRRGETTCETASRHVGLAGRASGRRRSVGRVRYGRSVRKSSWRLQSSSVYIFSRPSTIVRGRMIPGPVRHPSFYPSPRVGRASLPTARRRQQAAAAATAVALDGCSDRTFCT